MRMSHSNAKYWNDNRVRIEVRNSQSNSDSNAIDAMIDWWCNILHAQIKRQFWSFSPFAIIYTWKVQLIAKHPMRCIKSSDLETERITRPLIIVIEPHKYTFGCSATSNISFVFRLHSHHSKIMVFVFRMRSNKITVMFNSWFTIRFNSYMWLVWKFAIPPIKTFPVCNGSSTSFIMAFPIVMEIQSNHKPTEHSIECITC